jgi:hypothetical protein
MKSQINEITVWMISWIIQGYCGHGRSGFQVRRAMIKSYLNSDSDSDQAQFFFVITSGCGQF